jgi:hypothetical protein
MYSAPEADLVRHLVSAASYEGVTMIDKAFRSEKEKRERDRERERQKYCHLISLGAI